MCDAACEVREKSDVRVPRRQAVRVVLLWQPDSREPKPSPHVPADPLHLKAGTEMIVNVHPLPP